MTKNSIILYKNRPAVLKDFEKEKIIIELEDETKKVREKDAVLLVSDASSSIKEVLNAECPECDFEDVLDLLENGEYTFDSLVSLFWPSLPKKAYYKAWKFFSSSPYFSVTSPENNIKVHTKEEVQSQLKKEEEKKSILAEKNAFLELWKNVMHKKKKCEFDIVQFSHFFQDIEDVALGKREESKFLKEEHLTPEKAHAFLLNTEYWDIFKDPYPYRYNKVLGQAKTSLERHIIEEKYTDLTHLTSYAIDNEKTSDPDDAISYDGSYLFIHTALVADSVELGSEYDEMLLSRGSTLYLPWNTYYMMGKNDTRTFAIGLENPSYVLSFKILLDERANIKDVEVIRAKINVVRLTYAEATKLKEDAKLKCFFDIARANYEKRNQMGAISIDIPEVDVLLKEKTVHICERIEDDSFKMIKEMMLLAGEAASFFAFKNGIPFQYISQAPPTSIPKKMGCGIAKEFLKRRYMKARSVGISPLAHSSLGLSMYSQITSPMRRYGDLISQKQLLNYIDGIPCLQTEELFAKIASGDISYRDSQIVSKKSKKHFTLVYLLQHPEWIGSAVVIEMQEGRAQVFIQSLGLEVQMRLRHRACPNESINVRVLSIDLATLDVIFREAKNI